eukprot:2797537-Rhodomonas_salina.1
MWWEAEAEEAEAGWKTVGLTATTLPSRSASRLPPGAPRGSAPGALGPAMLVGRAALDVQSSWGVRYAERQSRPEVGH